MARIFRVCQENTAARCEHRARISTPRTRKRPPSPAGIRLLNPLDKPQSFQLGISRPGRRHAMLTVFTPRRLALLAAAQNTCVQTIPFMPDTL